MFDISFSHTTFSQSYSTSPFGLAPFQGPQLQSLCCPLSFWFPSPSGPSRSLCSSPTGLFAIPLIFKRHLRTSELLYLPFFLPDGLIPQIPVWLPHLRPEGFAPMSRTQLGHLCWGCWCPQQARETGWLKQQGFIFTLLEGQVQAGLVSPGACLPACRRPSSPCPHAVFALYMHVSGSQFPLPSRTQVILD